MFFRGESGFLAVNNSCVQVVHKLVKNHDCPLRALRRLVIVGRIVYKRSQNLRRLFRSECTICPQILGIEFLPDFRNLFADEKVELDSFFDFFDTVDSGGVVFAPEFLSDSRKTEVKFAAQ